jgi:hypothetical protein
MPTPARRVGYAEDHLVDVGDHLDVIESPRGLPPPVQRRSLMKQKRNKKGVADADGDVTPAGLSAALSGDASPLAGGTFAASASLLLGAVQELQDLVTMLCD